ncbi:MAG: GTP 3',8-cyclase MoaA [Anaerolineae bacterium]|nr:GTP 3',8-cyclase MoaA [Anaerolineae bacterium]MDW8102975.1 GTP 3',8-cyclase MoaA [Anaerolineae bacterium]
MGCIDAYNRSISYLRISVTDRCNLRCVYCMPEHGVPLKSHHELLTLEEIVRVVKVAASLGITKIRLTGGEPLIRRGIVELVRMISSVPGIEDLAMTTNGILLPFFAHKLKEAGLKRVNISLDTLKPERFRQITRVGNLEDVIKGIEEAKRAGLTPIKINMVVLEGFNRDEVVDFARLTLQDEWHVRFIEVMPVGSEAENNLGKYVSMQEVREDIERTFGPLNPADLKGNGPARYFRLEGAKGTIGFITPVSEHFCYECNRLRLTSDGKLRPCLLSEFEVDIKAALRAGATDEELREVIKEAVRLKPERHNLEASSFPRGRAMAEIGG